MLSTAPVAGTASQSVTFTPNDTTDYTSATGSVNVTVAPAPTTITLTASSTSITPGQSVTLTATVTSSNGLTPTGTVSFYDNGVLLGSPSLDHGTARYDTAALTPGSTNTITAVYSGDSNFSASGGGSSGSSVSITVAALDYTLVLSGPSNATLVPGGSVVYTLTVTPTYGSYAGTVSFSVSGLPSGAIATFSPSTIAANGGAQTVTVTIKVPAIAAHTPPAPSLGRRMAPTALALLPLLGVGRMRRQGRRLHRLLCLLLLMGGLVASAALSGCGGGGFFAQAEKSYTVTIAAASGGITHTATLTLEVQ
jgi:hypothetical protein